MTNLFKPLHDINFNQPYPKNSYNWLRQGIYLDQSSYGVSVFTDSFIPKGTIIEQAIMLPIKGPPDIGHYNDHLFTWSDDRTIWCAGTGLTSFYNHSDTPNIVKKSNLKTNIMQVYALNDIEPNTQLTNTYLSKKWRECFKKF